MFLKDTGIQGFQILTKALLLTLFLLFNFNESFSKNLELKGNESEEFVIPSKGISRSKVIEVAKQCLERSSYKDEYLVNKFKVHYDRVSHVWGIEFKKKGGVNDTCMYRAIIEKDSGRVTCQCLYGL